MNDEAAVLTELDEYPNPLSEGDFCIGKSDAQRAKFYFSRLELRSAQLLACKRQLCDAIARAELAEARLAAATSGDPDSASPAPLCLKKFGNGRTCVRRLGHEGEHTRYGIRK